MDQVPNDSEEFSIKLSEVLSDIGVNERMILKRRRLILLQETMCNMHEMLAAKVFGNLLPIFNIIPGLLKRAVRTYYILGSQSEGTTTLGLSSDYDFLFHRNSDNLIQDWNDWKPCVNNLLMIQDDSVSPGYCYLQMLRPDVPLPMELDVVLPVTYIDRAGRVLLKNILLPLYTNDINGVVSRGPAMTIQVDQLEQDLVFAISCATWPLHARPWLAQQGIGQWPTGELKRYCRGAGCFVVAVGRKGSGKEEIEWRVSTSLAERCLMFSLNITQIRCYILMKMIKKTFIDPLYEDVISSFMCKTVLFHCIANNQSSIWREDNLQVCLLVCVRSMYTNIRDEYCPHFIMPRNNLMRGKIPLDIKPHILEILKHFIDSEGSDLLAIKYDDLGIRLRRKFNNIHSFKTCEIISGKLLFQTSCGLQYFFDGIVFIIALDLKRLLKPCIYNLLNLECHNKVKRTAINLFASKLGALLGSVLASHSIQQSSVISAEALQWMTQCLNTDVASSKLKLASMLYCTRQYERTEVVLSRIEEKYDPDIVEPLCQCHTFERQALRPGFNAVCDQHGEEAIQYCIANCVRFLTSEVHCVPKELKQEMFRSTSEDKSFRGLKDYWMDYAVADSLTFLYFLQYKIYYNLGKQEKKHQALANLVKTIDQEPNLGHRETALNLLGQCMEQEDRARNALQCYSLSLNVRRRNNAAKIHICRLLNKLYHNQQ